MFNKAWAPMTSPRQSKETQAYTCSEVGEQMNTKARRAKLWLFMITKVTIKTIKEAYKSKAVWFLSTEGI